jgi:hypothetical protein
VSKGPPGVSRFLLHDPSDMDMSIGGIGGERKFSIWGRVLEWHRRRQEAFCILEGLLSGSGPLQRFGPSLQRISQRSQNLSTVGQKAAVKVKVAPVSTKYLLLVFLSVRKISPALAGKCTCIAAAVACVGLAAKLKVVRRQASFPTNHRACEPCGRSNCEI